MSFLFLFASLSASAAVQETLVVSTVHGEVFSQFTMEKKGKKYILSVSQSNGKAQNRNLNEKDFQFILKEFGKLPTANLKSSECYRSRMNVVLLNNGLPVQKKASCFGNKVVTAPAFTRFAQILVRAL